MLKGGHFILLADTTHRALSNAAIEDMGYISMFNIVRARSQCS